MPKAWKDVIASSDYQDLSATDKFRARREYFNEVVAPQVPPEQLDTARDEFYSDTNDKSFSTLDDVAMTADSAIRRVADGATFGLADKAVAAGRAAFDSNLDYDTALAQERAATDTASEVLGTPGTIAADLTGGLLTGGGLAAKGVTLMGKGAGLVGNVLGGAAEGAIYGAVNGLGHADAGLDPTTNLAAAGEGAAYGGAAGAAGGALASALSPAMRALFGRSVDTNAGLSDGTRLGSGAQRVIDNALDPAMRQPTLDRMALMGNDAMALNANRRLGSLAQGIASRPGEGSDIVRNAVEAQMAGRSNRILAGADDALGPVGRDKNLIIEKADEAIRDNSPEYTKLLTGQSVKPQVRQSVADTAKTEFDKWGSGSPIGSILSKFRDIKNLPANAIQLRNMKVIFSNLEKKYPEAKSSFYAVKQAIDGALDTTTGGAYKTLQGVHANARSDIEAAQRAAGFLDGSVPSRIVTADLTKTGATGANGAARADMMREVMRDSVDRTLTGPGNDISNLQKLMGRHGNAGVRENLAAGFGQPAADKMVRLVESEAKKTADYGRIIAGSKTAETRASDAALDDAIGAVPMLNNHSALGITAELAATAMRKLLSMTNGAKGTTARAAIGKVSTMNREQLVKLLGELDRAKTMRKLNGVLKSAVVNAGVQASAPSR
jgi:hypothetical protein